MPFMAQTIRVRRLGHEEPGWEHTVLHVPRVGEVLAFGCAQGEEMGTIEGNALTHGNPWCVHQVVHHLLCPTEAAEDGQLGVLIDILVVPLIQQEVCDGCAADTARVA
jgi:hypothetical protein